MARGKTKYRRSSRNSLSPIITIAVIAGIVLAIGVLLSITGGGNASASTSRSGNTVDFTMNDFSGKSVRLSDYRGHPVLVNLWASWCPPYRAEMPTLIQFYNQHQAEGFMLLAVNSTDNADSARQFIQAQGMPFPVLFDPQGKAMQMFNTDGLPSSYLIDRNGKIVFSRTGGISSDILNNQVAPLLSQ